MNTKRRRQMWIGFFPLLGVLLTVLFSACSSVTPSQPVNAPETVANTTSETTSSMPSTSPNAPVGAQTTQLLVKTAQAMQQVKFVHLEVTGTGTFRTTGGALPTPPPMSAAYTLTLHSNVATVAQQESGKGQVVVTQGQSKTVLPLTEVVSGQKLYYKVSSPPAQGKQKTAPSQWMVMDLAALFDQLKTTTAGNQAQNLSMLLAQHMTITDKGVLRQKGIQVHHLVATISQQGLDQIAANTTQPMAEQVLSSIQLQKLLQIDLFINEGSGLLQQVEINGQFQINLDMLTGKGRIKQADVGVPPHMMDMTTATHITFSRYNQPIHINVPKIKNSTAMRQP